MKAIIQRVSSARVVIDDNLISKIDYGLLVLLGIQKGDIKTDINYIINKLINLRIFNDNDNNMNLSIKDINGEILVVSQFTLLANTIKGRRPSFCDAENPIVAKKIYNEFCKKLFELSSLFIATGKFGKMMDIHLINNGPVTILLDSRKI